LDEAAAGGIVSWVEDWPTHGACSDTDPDSLFVQGAAQNRAKAVCGGCPVRAECLADALDNRIEFGVWGGMTERERRALLRRRPEVVSWRRVLESARQDYDSRPFPMARRSQPVSADSSS
jgi:WhiB family transcriptional regulator, redox-sensing transcriptional regulator